MSSKFKIGFEIHQRLDTHKLFCSCSCDEAADEEISVTRRLRPVMSEQGSIDKAALYEYMSGKYYEYHAPNNSSCLVELDEEPPHEVNSDALNIILQISKLFNARPVEEVHPMRKIVIDGSNTSGFQRTMLIAHDGYFEMFGKRITIPTIYLEEESAYIIEKSNGKAAYRLDRLGIPLVELSTGVIEGINPEEAKEIAYRIGKLLRATGRVKRGIGTIRQDINISIPNGSRVEIKGAQELDTIPELIRREIQRQEVLLSVKEVISNLDRLSLGIVDLTNVFKSTKCRFISRSKFVLGIKLKGFKGILGIETQPGRRVGSELSDYAKQAGVGGIIHSDEDLSKYPISNEEVNLIREKLSITGKDAFVLVAVQDRSTGERALRYAIDRANMLFDGVPSEVRKALPDGNTSFMRPMPGAARMYPETDIPPFVIDTVTWDNIQLPELPEETEERLRKLGLSDDLTHGLVSSGDFILFDNIIKSVNADPKLVATTLVNTKINLRRDGVNVDSLSDEMWLALFSANLPKEAIPIALEKLAKTGDKGILNSLKGMSEDEARVRIQKIISKIPDLRNKRNPFAVAMGEVMKELRGKVDGGLISRLVREELR